MFTPGIYIDFMEFSSECHFVLHSHSNNTSQIGRKKKKSESSAMQLSDLMHLSLGSSLTSYLLFNFLFERETRIRMVSLHVLIALYLKNCLKDHCYIGKEKMIFG
jgi:hypothetical protein